MSRPALVAHADWSVSPRKRWLTVAKPHGTGWTIDAPEPVGDVGTLLARLRRDAGGAPVALGVDAPIGLPRAYAERHAGACHDFPAFLRALGPDDPFLDVCETAEEIGPARPFYPRRWAPGVTRAALVQRLGLSTPDELFRLCERKTATRRRAAPLFWTLGANQVGKAALSLWRDLLLASSEPPSLWPFEGDLHQLLTARSLVVAETYPAEALVQLELQLNGSKRSQDARRALAPRLLGIMGRLGAEPSQALSEVDRDRAWNHRLR